MAHKTVRSVPVQTGKTISECTCEATLQARAVALQWYICNVSLPLAFGSKYKYTLVDMVQIAILTQS